MSWRRLAHPAFLIAMGLALGAAGGHRAAIKANKIYLRKLPIQAPEGRMFHTLPDTAGMWTAIPSSSDKPLSEEVLETLGTRNYVSRQYVKKFGDKLVNMELHCAYYTGMVDTVPHVPDTCFVGGGMALVRTPRQAPVALDLSRFGVDRDAETDAPVHVAFVGPTNERVRMPQGVDALKMNVARFKQGATDVYAGYFFVANGTTTPTAESVRLLAFDLTNDYAYYAKVQFTSAAVNSEEELASVAGDFLNDMLPEIMRRVPDWTEVAAGRYPPDNPRARTKAASAGEQR